MYKNSSIAVVVPAYNEAAFIGDVLKSIPEYIDRIYVVDDGSADETWTEIERTATRMNARTDKGRDRVVPLQHEENRGVGAAIKTGYQRAHEERIHATAVMAGDGQMNPDELKRFLDPIVEGRADYAKGNRLWRREHWQSMSRWRRFGNRLLTILTRISSGYWEMSDPQNGYTVISDRALETIALDELYDDYGFANDILVHLNVYELCIVDVPHEAVYGDEESGIRYDTFVPHLSILLFRDFLWRLKKKYLTVSLHPIALCYALGAAGTVSSVFKGLSSVRSRYTGNENRNNRVDGIVLLFLSSLFFILAVLFDMRESEGLVLQVDDDVSHIDSTNDGEPSRDETDEHDLPGTNHQVGGDD
ncbi:glycosyltransferase family 2 protein [Salinigranum halophilum]|uniref:glycosyltransferase family 2 protein n=1 Tax=Salinigranum halophilum TaxID=2565931 RepID=UPI0010A873A8|nr:glycosyltransferase family 2 protein [Salinigranum halophilum]